MAKIKVLIVEDEPLYAGQLEMLVLELGYLPLAKVSSGDMAIDMVQATQPDLLLMDINIDGDKDGIETAAIIHKTHNIPVIFITSMQDDATFERAKSAAPYAFITKPFSAKKLQRTIELAIARMQPQQEKDNSAWADDILVNDSFYIKVKNTLEKVTLTDIQWIEVVNRDCIMHTIEKPLTVRISLTELIAKLPEEFFLQVHRSFIVNINHIASVDLTNNRITIKGNQIPISKAHKDDILEKLQIL